MRNPGKPESKLPPPTRRDGCWEEEAGEMAETGQGCVQCAGTSTRLALGAEHTGAWLGSSCLVAKLGGIDK